MGKIKPRFNAKAPKNWGEFFSRRSDEEFRKEHPIGYIVLVTAGIAAVILPAALYYFLATAVFDTDHMLSILGVFDAFIMGVGCFNIVAAFIGQYLGHKLTIITFTAGFTLCALSIILG